jgi:hypothetical protein
VGHALTACFDPKVWILTFFVKMSNPHPLPSSIGVNIDRCILIKLILHKTIIDYAQCSYALFSGAHMLSSTTAAQQFRRASQLFYHSYFTVDHLERDVAILRLAQPVAYNYAIQPIALPTPGSSIAVGTNCLLSGLLYT